jgi:hypothetical protein
MVGTVKVPVNVGDADRTTLPVPVLVVTPVPPYATATVVPFHTPVAIVPTLDKLESVVTAVFTSVPLVGSVTDVVPVIVNVVPKEPLIVKVLAVLFAMPVPPRFGATATPFHVALVIDPAQSSVLVDQLTFEGV